ncbi:predicted protein [Postia placenta Mad-698-R]|nr:predicted protein [Postia placenta Mad-698-R]
MQLALQLTLSTLALSALACPGDDHAHAHADHVPLTPPSKPLVWSDFKCLWVAARAPAPLIPRTQLQRGLWGLSSFVTHMKQIALGKDVDLLIDTSDLHDVNAIMLGSDWHVLPADRLYCARISILACILAIPSRSNRQTVTEQLQGFRYIIPLYHFKKCRACPDTQWLWVHVDEFPTAATP